MVEDIHVCKKCNPVSVIVFNVSEQDLTDGELEQEEDIHVCKKCNLVSVIVFDVSEQDLTDGELEDEEEDIHVCKKCNLVSVIVFDVSEQDLTDGELEDEEEDIHVCKKCNLAFKDIQKYLAHKVKHDNYKIKYCRSEVDKRMIMPKLVHRPIKKEPEVPDQENQPNGKENEEMPRKRRRGRKKQIDTINQDLVIKEKPVYTCNKCDRKFNREATLKRHNEMEHANSEDDDDDDDGFDEDNEDDKDVEYRPSIAEIKVEVQEANEDAEDMPPLTAEEMEEAVPADGVHEDQLARQGEGVEAGTLDGQTVAKSPPVNIHIIGGPSEKVLESPVRNVRLNKGPPPKRQKLSEEEKSLRKFACHICFSQFKELAVLKTHMLVHTSRRTYACQEEGCTYAFKTKGSLRRHMRRHTGERPFPCEMCGRTFVESGALTRHLRSRVPCTAKSDNDLPRYGKRWDYTPNIPATMRPESSVPEPAVGEDPSSLQLDNLQDAFVVGQTVTIAGISVSTGSDTLATVVQVLDSDLPADEQNLIKAVVESANEGQEVVVDPDGCLTDDDSMSQFVQSETEIGNITTSCKVCNEDFFTLDTLKVHLRTHLADDALKCWLCHFITENKDQFTEHMFTQHAVQLQASDPFTTLVVACDNEDKDQQDIHKDAQVAVKQLLDLPSDPVDGDQEPAEFSTRLMYKCPVCMRKFRGSNYLKLHMRNHTGLRPHKCTKCDKSFITKDTLNKHMNVHVEERNFKCGECGKLFKRLSHVREHIKIHSAARSFPCTVCDKSFKTNNAMKVHLRTHTDILPYVCNFCHRRFREKGSVIRHKRIHTGEKPYECKNCGRCFAEHGTLNRHLKAKSMCHRTKSDSREKGNDFNEDYTVLAEFSSVVADTQKYIVSQENTGESPNSLMVEQDEAQQAAEYVVVQTDMSEQEVQEIQNVEIVANNDGTNLVEGVEVSDNYIVITDEETRGMKIIDSRTGETVAYVPVGAGDEADPDSQTVLVSADIGTEIEAVAMAPLMDNETDELASVLAQNTTCVQIQELEQEDS